MLLDLQNLTLQVLKIKPMILTMTGIQILYLEALFYTEMEILPLPSLVQILVMAVLEISTKMDLWMLFQTDSLL